MLRGCILPVRRALGFDVLSLIMRVDEHRILRRPDLNAEASREDLRELRAEEHELRRVVDPDDERDDRACSAVALRD
jgi:hypothetical protein